MTADRKAPPHDPTAERTADQSTQGAGGLHQDVDAIKRRPGAEVAHDGAEESDTAFRNDEDLYDTPRRYETEDREAPVVPSNDSGSKTKF